MSSDEQTRHHRQRIQHHVIPTTRDLGHRFSMTPSTLRLNVMTTTPLLYKHTVSTSTNTAETETRGG
jgi:hypothetical protein